MVKMVWYTKMVVQCYLNLTGHYQAKKGKKSIEFDFLEKHEWLVVAKSYFWITIAVSVDFTFLRIVQFS
jgi:hypothetical protein